MSEQSVQLRRNHWWIRDSHNPVLPLGEAGSFDATSCMNPCVLRKGDTYYLYYAGGDREGHRRICLATAAVANPTQWQRHGPLFDVGEPGSFDARWCVLPHVVQIAPDRWHLYYTGNSGVGEGLSAFPGMGLAISTDGERWEKYAESPILAPTGRDGDPDAKGIAGGSVLKVTLPNGATEWRFYYTGCPTVGDDLFLHQQKCCCLAVSQDGVEWERRGAVMVRDPDRDYENVAAAGPVVMQEADGSFRMWYSAIGTRWGAYSIAYAESADGITWTRGHGYGDNLQLGPIGTDWERQMVEYPSVIHEDDRLRLFYCGNGYGSSGIGTALSSPLRATPTSRCGEVDVVAPETQQQWRYVIPREVRCAEGVIADGQGLAGSWHGPDAKGMLWYEWSSLAPGSAAASSHARRSTATLDELTRVRMRVLLTPSLHGLEVRFTVANGSEQTLHGVSVDIACREVTQGDGGDFTPRVVWDGEAAHGGGLGDIVPGATVTGCAVIELAAN